RDQLLGELDNHVGNTFGIVQAIALETLSKAHETREVREAFLARLEALSNVQNLLAAQAWRGVALADLVHAELGGLKSRVDLRGDDVQL
ncbi:HWE histidine kinase domain-containing protein, partial [Enterococcus casseliflavus]|uniref:HWE histidine kinase domain-containing protein n=1 Tax=Enterococcus casseliflavus TaxID=37734 RepID=UPI003D0D1863